MLIKDLFGKNRTSNEAIEHAVNHAMDLLDNPDMSCSLKKSDIFVIPLCYHTGTHIGTAVIIDNKASVSQFKSWEDFCDHGKKLIYSFQNAEYHRC